MKQHAKAPLRATGTIGFALLLLTLAGCATWREPTDISAVPLEARAVTQTNRGVQLSAAVLGSEDSLRMFGFDVNATGIQPVWLEVRNGTDQPLWLLRSGTDPDYFSPLEVAWSAHVTFGGRTNEQIDEHFDRMALPNPVPAGGTARGILFTNPQPVTKLLNVDLLGDKALIPFTLILPVPGDVADASNLVFKYADAELANCDDLDDLRRALEQAPCCADADGPGTGEPFNVVLVGRLDDLGAAMNRRGYRRDVEPTAETQRAFGRPPDFVARKRAQAGAPANWLRLWRMPINYRGQVVFLVQTGRPVGGRFRDQDATEIRLHPDVDEARNLLIQDVMYSAGLEKLGFVSGVGPASPSQPRQLAEGGSYFTDGLRATMFFGTRPRTFSEVEVLDWEPVLRQWEAEAAKELDHAGN